MKVPSNVAGKFTPAGKLRVSINLGNPVLARRDPGSGSPVGVSIDLADNFAERLGVGIEFVLFDSAGKSVEAVTREEADIGFFAVDPLRAQGIAFTAPYLLIEGCYLVRQDSEIRSNEEADSPGYRVVVGKGSAYDLFLTRELRHARIVRAPTSPAVVDVFIEQNIDIAAGVKQQLEDGVRRYPGLRLLPGRFMVIRQAIGLPKSRGAEAAALLGTYVEEMKRSGFVAKALSRHGIQGVSVAPMDG
jgi:polar amino acid transport system substrate-binding protein